ncbi:hypothetical protein J1N35_024363 [Gossypium stocksii]|uniref:Secreted protein n=1 Tax=Gossypium stocksii TaxID=47602 RepID=A0A9D3V4Y7_9ROSI|nr:hypothetical protein J1N35_024363 [Gossypium stocksii]
MAVNLALLAACVWCMSARLDSDTYFCSIRSEDFVCWSIHGLIDVFHVVNRKMVSCSNGPKKLPPLDRGNKRRAPRAPRARLSQPTISMRASGKDLAM